MSRGAKKGERRGGRQKGVPNKLTIMAKEAIEAVFENMGGVDQLTTWAMDNQRDFYCVIYPKIIPLQVNADVNANVARAISGEPLTKDQWDAAYGGGSPAPFGVGTPKVPDGNSGSDKGKTGSVG